MAEELKSGVRVRVKEKNLDGTVRFVGVTSFAPGKWVGVELDELKGKNNGTVQGKEYFHCENNHGLMVRQNQLQIIPDVKTPSQPSRTSGIPTLTSKRPGSGKKTSPQSSSASSPRPSKHGTPARPQQRIDSDSSLKTVRTPAVEVDQGLTSSGQSSVSEEAHVFSGSGSVEPEKMSEITDLNQRLAILQSKRAEDKARIKELEKFKAQYAQMTEYKQRWSESQSDLQQQLRAAKKEARDHQLAKEKVEEEMRDLMDTVEMATLDKEMAEERSESLQAEADALKEKVEELTIELEVIKEEINEGGVEGAAANAQFKQMEQQNSRLKEALLRLRDLSAQEKLEHQHVVKDLEKTSTALLLIKDQKEKLAKEMEEADAIIDELKDQVDAALGAEEMVEKLTDNNLELEEKLTAMAETVADLEVLRDLSEEQEELRMEVEHDLREELDMSLNSVRLMEQKLEATQETIIDQQQTIEKFRDLVRNLNVDIRELRSTQSEQGGVSSEKAVSESKSSMASLNVQLKSAVKAQARTIDFELRKLETQQAAEQINHLVSFMPSTFLISGGDYDALLVLMLLPRMTFKVELIIDQLKNQYKFDELMGSLSTITPAQMDKLIFVANVVLKLSQFNLLVNRANSILKECDVHLYRQMGGVRDDLTIHEKTLDILIDLLKKEQLDESVPLANLDKAISHLESILERRMKLEEGTQVPHECASHLLDQVVLLACSCDTITLQLQRTRSLVPEGSSFAVQLKEMETINGDIRQAAKKIRRRAATGLPGKLLVYNKTVAGSVDRLLVKHTLYAQAFNMLCAKASQKANSLSDGEKLAAGEFDEFIRKIVSNRVLQEFTSEVSSLSEPNEMFGKGLKITHTGLDDFLSALSEGKYDVLDPKLRIEAPIAMRAQAVKAELSDVEGLGFRLEERQQDILQLKKSLKLKAQEVSEAGVKIGLLEKKLESFSAENRRLVDAEKEEAKKLKDQLERQKDDFRQTIFVLQGDIEALESEKADLENKLKMGPAADGKGSHKIRMVGPPGTSSSPFLSRKQPSSVTEAESERTVAEGSAEQGPLLLARIESLSKALEFSTNENFRLKAKIAKAQLNSLSPLQVPHHLVVKLSKGDVDTDNHTDQEKQVLKRTASLINDLKKVCLQKVVVSTPGSSVPPQDNVNKSGGGDDDESAAVNAARERLSNNIVGMYELQRRVKALREDAQKVIRSQCPGSTVDSTLASFNAPHFSKVLDESRLSAPTAVVRLNSNSPDTAQAAINQRLQLSPAQFYALHETVVS